MKPLVALLGLLVALLLALAFQQHQRATALQIEIHALTGDRDEMKRRLTSLERRVNELADRDAARQALADGARASDDDASHPSTSTSAPSAARAKSKPVGTPGVTTKVPTGWGKNGSNPESYIVGVDSNNSWGGMPSAYVKSNGAEVEGFGGMMQSISSESYAGKRIKLSGWVKTEDANQGGGHLWLRVDGHERDQMLGFDNMDNRPVKGTTDWQEASIVLDVPANAASLNYGFFVAGGGQMWVNGQRIEVVDENTPTTNMITKQGQPRNLPKQPTNLGFDPNRPK